MDVFLALLFVLVCSFPIFCLCQVWFLILPISDLCLILYCYFVCKILTEEQLVDLFVYIVLLKDMLYFTSCALEFLRRFLA